MQSQPHFPYISLISPLYFPYISLTFPLHFPYISLTFPLHFPYISLTFPLRNAQERRFRAEIERKRQQIEDSAADTLRCVERHVTRVVCDM